MQLHPLVGIVSLLALLLFFVMSARVGRGRVRYGVTAPAVAGHPNFERDYRIQMNTLEWLPIFLVSLWLFALAWGSDRVAAGIGLVWIIGRILYLTGYAKAAEARGPGFGIQRWRPPSCSSARSGGASGSPFSTGSEAGLSAVGRLGC